VSRRLHRGYSAIEDVPIIIPIAVALIMFFASFGWAIKTVNEANDRVDMTLSLIRVADAFSSQGVINKSLFNNICDSAKSSITDVGFLVFHATDLKKLNNLVKHHLKKGTMPCSYNTSKYPCCTNSKTLSSNRMLVRVFPVTYNSSVGSSVPENNVTYLVVVVWPKG
jgi:hypothetical protein